MQHAVKEHHIRPRLYLQMQVRSTGCVRDTRIDHDDLHLRAQGLGFFDSSVQNGVRKSSIAARDEKTMCVINVLIASRGRVRTQRQFVGRHGAAHAKPGVRVDVVRSDQTLGELIENVVVLGEELPGDVKTQCISAMGLNDSHQPRAHLLLSLLPSHRPQRRSTMRPHHGLQKPRGKRVA